MSIPNLLDQAFPIESLNADEEEEDVVQPTNISKPGDDTETEKDKIHQRILILEAQIEKSNKSATESPTISQEKLKRFDLENRIEELELEKKRNLSKKKIHQYQQQQQQLPMVAVVNDDIDDDVVVNDVDYCTNRTLERDDALDLVREIRKLMVKN